MGIEVDFMPVKLGAKAEHGFDEPLGLLSDCHRRIEHFLAVLERVILAAPADALADEQRHAVETALGYFKNAAPRHTQDEERSLFPLMRASGQPRAREALRALDALEQDHAAADVAHAEVEASFRRWLDQGRLADSERQRLADVLGALRQMYRRHIDVEEREIFPLAGQILSPDQVGRVGREMASRRGLPPPSG
jgi:hemerythrin-like domain-containing protein